MVNVRFITTMGEFVAEFSTFSEAESAIGSEYIFEAKGGGILIIHVPMQYQSVIIITEDVE